MSLCVCVRVEPVFVIHRHVSNGGAKGVENGWQAKQNRVALYRVVVKRETTALKRFISGAVVRSRPLVRMKRKQMALAVLLKHTHPSNPQASAVAVAAATTATAYKIEIRRVSGQFNYNRPIPPSLPSSLSRCSCKAKKGELDKMRETIDSSGLFALRFFFSLSFFLSLSFSRARFVPFSTRLLTRS